MRRPDQYELLSEFFRDTIIQQALEKPTVGKLYSEASDWSKPVRGLVGETAEGLMLLVFEFAPIIRLITEIREKTITVSIAGFGRPLGRYIAAGITARIERRNPSLRDIRSAQESLLYLSGSQA